VPYELQDFEHFREGGEQEHSWQINEYLPQIRRTPSDACQIFQTGTGRRKVFPHQTKQDRLHGNGPGGPAERHQGRKGEKPSIYKAIE
jgi:hypothetical protein